MSDYKKSLIIKNRTSSGFFSNFLIFVDNVKYCEMNEIKPILTMENNYFYNDGRDNLWNSFFEPFNDNIRVGEEIESNFFLLWNEKFLVHQGKVMVWENSENQEESTKNRLEVYETVKKFTPSKEIQNIVDNFVNTNFSNQKVIGVHIRGTDYGFHDLDQYVKAIQQYESFDKVYVASDNQQSIDYIANHFDNVCFYDTDIRKKDINEDVLCRNLSNDLRVKHGQDVFVESLLLSKCNHLISVNSNVAAAALYFNPYMTYNMIYRCEVGG